MEDVSVTPGPPAGQDGNVDKETRRAAVIYLLPLFCLWVSSTDEPANAEDRLAVHGGEFNSA